MGLGSLLKQLFLGETPRHASTAPPPSPVQPVSGAAVARTRLSAEQAIVARYFPGFAWTPSGTQTLAEGVLRINSGNAFRVRLVLPPDFPSRPPRAYVLSPALRGRGYSLHEASHRMHTLSPDEHGHVQLCTYNSESWVETNTVYHVLMKVRLWLEAYEMHLASGEPIAHFLRAA